MGVLMRLSIRRIEDKCWVSSLEKQIVNFIEDISYNYHLFTMNQEQIIRGNRQKIRTGLKKILSINTTNNTDPKPHKSQSQEEELPVTRFRRKTSADVRQIGNCWDMFQFNQLITSSIFQQFYELKEKIDEGAHSIVYVCLQKDTQHLYAVKVIKIKDFDIIFSLKQQFRVLKNLDHPNIIKAHRLFINQQTGVSHVVCEYCPAENLRIHMNKNRILSQMEAADILTSLLHTLKYLHSNGVCHRDIKPENILYDFQKGQLKLIDFQISKMIKYQHQKLQMWSNTGTIAYKAPEMFSGGYTQLIDIWAVGVIAYELVIGSLPFHHLYSNQQIRKICEEEPNYDKPDITKACIDFLKKCLHKNPLHRFTAREALHSPFLLKFSSLSSSAESPKFKRNGSEGKRRQSFEIECMKCLDEDSQLKNKREFENDGGIRVVMSDKN